MALTERLALIVSLDAQGAVKGLEKVGKTAEREMGKTESRIDRTAKGFQKAGVGMVGTAGILGVGLYKAGQSAADLEQAIGGTEAVFKDASGTIDRFAKDSASSMGLSERAFREATTSIGGQLKGLGFSTDDAADKAIELTGVAADLAATYGGTTAEAVQALGAAFRGEADPAERFNLRLNQNTVNAKAVALGLAESTAKVDAQAKAQATLALITEQSSDAQGQFAREAGSAAGAMQIANAEFENAKASLGESVAPIMADVASKLSGVASGFSSVNQASGGALSKIATFGTIALAAGGGLSYVVGKTIEMRDTLAPLGGRLRTAEGGLTRLGKAGAGAGAALAAIGLVQLGMELDGFHSSVGDVSGALANLNDENRAAIDTILTLAQATGDLDTVVSQAADANVLGAEKLVDYAEANGYAGDQVDELRQIIEDKRQADIEGAKDQQEYSSQVNAAVDPTNALAGAQSGLTEAVEDTGEAYRGLIDAVIGFADADLSLRESIDKTDDSLIELAEAQQAAADKGFKNREANEALEDALFNAEGAMLAQAEAAVAAAEKNAELGGKTLDASDKQKILRDNLAYLAGGLAAGSPLRKNIDATILRLDALATDRSAQINIMINERKVSTASKRNLEGRASGGPVTSGQTYLVGERGPELLTMPANGYVTPNNQIGGSSVTNIAITTGADPQAVVEAIKRYTKQNGPAPIQVAS